ncbi:MAG TPA: nucleotidyltransferase domain-containing protein [Candidatus Saccharimonadales bacterium]|nr:nucleotidyltransferase domain-containing protein [Candidatus Saccharimonadales bacterium]
MVNSLEAITDNIQSEFWAMLGLEEGVQEQTSAALDIMREVAADLPHMEDVAVIPVGSRVKGYATLSSDVDIAIVAYEENAAPFKARIAMGRVITERLGIQVCQLSFPDRADEALTIDMIDYGHLACFDAKSLPFALVPAVFEGTRVAERKRAALEKRRQARNSFLFLRSADEAYTRYFVEPKFEPHSVACRYINVAQNAGLDWPELTDLERVFQAAYTSRNQAFGSSVLTKINQELT